MAWWGKVVGGAFGFMLGGPLGALLGVSLGHRFDAGAGATARPDSLHHRAGDQERVQMAFFTATFAVMGHITKADGRVTRDEIALVEQLMTHLRLTQAQRALAKSLFEKGKRVDFELETVVVQLRRECHRRGTLVRMFMEIQVQAALADGRIAPQENDILQRVAHTLGLAHGELERLIERLRAAHTDSPGKPEPLSLANAYRVLGVTKHTPLPKVRKAYRRLRSQHHPDKLVSKGLPEEMIKFANEKSHQIRAAWERVKQAHPQA